MASRRLSPTAGRSAPAAMGALAVALAVAVPAVPSWPATAPAEPALDAGPDPWFELAVPEGTAGLARAAGLDPATESWRLLPDLTRRLHVSFGERTAARALPHVAAVLASGSATSPAAPVMVAVTAPAPAPPAPLMPPMAGDADDGPVLFAPAGPEVPAVAAPDAPGPRGADRVPVPLSPAAWDAILGRGKGSGHRDLLATIATDGAAARLYRGLATLDKPTLTALAGETDSLREVYRHHSDAFSIFAPSFRVEAGRVAVPGGHAQAALWQDLVGASVMQPGRFLAQLAAADQGRLFFFYDAIDRLDPAHQRFALAIAEPDAGRREDRVRALRAVFASAEPWWEASHLPFSRPVADAPRVLEGARVTTDGQLAAPSRQVLWTAAFDDQGDAPAQWRARLAQSPPADAAWLAERIATADAAVGRSRLGMLAFAQRALADPEHADPADLLAALRGFGRYRALALSLERMGLREPALHAAAERQAEQLERAGSGDRARISLSEFQGALVLVERASAAATLEAADAARLVRTLSDVTLEDGRYGERVAVWIRGQLLPVLRGRLALPAAASAETVVLRAISGRSDAAPPRLQWEGLAYDVDPAAAEYRRLVGIRRRQGGGRLDEALSAPAAEIESRLSSVLVDLAYAAALGPAENAPAASEDVARRHDFGFEEAVTSGAPRAAWGLPREAAGPGQRWHARGALLGLDLGLARLSLRRLDTEVPPEPALAAADRRGFTEDAVLVRATGVGDPGRDAIVSALAKGRARLAAAAADAALVPALVADLGLRDWRRGTLAWIASHDGAHLESALSLGEVYWLGAADSTADAARAAAAWGASGRSDDGCLCLRLGRPSPFDALAGRVADGRLAALSPDLHLRVAELMAEMGLPSRLAPAILTLATQDLIDDAEPAYLEDGLSVSRFARGLTRTRMEDYVAALAGRGPLVPAGSP